MRVTTPLRALMPKMPSRGFPLLSRAVLPGILLAFFAVACSSPAEEEPLTCTEGAVRDCYEGPENTFGVGECRAGEQVCVKGNWGPCEGQVLPAEEVCDGKDNNCDGRTDEDLLNACGGCSELEGTPGEACLGCGNWECIGPDHLECTVAGEDPEGDSSCKLEDPENHCKGVQVCLESGEVVCKAVEEPNVCGLCGGPELEGLGEECSNDQGCTGVWRCSEDSTALICDAPSKNNCGVCGALDIPLVGESCGEEVGAAPCIGENCSPCPGEFQCNEDNTAAVCVPSSTRNECGLCGGAPLPDLGETCTVGDIDICTSTWKCNDAGDALECGTQGPNNCGGCDLPDVPNLDGPCEDADGCPGVQVCNPTKDGTICSVPVTLNSCERCAPEVENLGDDCSDNFQCQGTFVCADVSDQESDSYCLIDAPEEIGNNCVDENGCPGVFHCGEDNAAICVTTEGTCSFPDYPVFSQISLGRGEDNKIDAKDQFIEIYNPSSSETIDLRNFQLWFTNAVQPPPAGSVVSCITCPTAQQDSNACSEGKRWSNAWNEGGECEGKALLPPRSYFLFGTANYSGDVSADATLNITLHISYSDPSQDGQIWLFDTAPHYEDTPPVDLVGWRNAKFYEGAPVPIHDRSPVPPGPNKPPIGSMMRKAFSSSTSSTMAADGSDAGLGNRIDTDNNAADFVILKARRPRNSGSAPEPPFP